MNMRIKTEADIAAAKIIVQMFGGIVYTFHRADGFYPLTLQSDEEAIANAKCNKGTLRVTNELSGDVVFEAK